MTRRIMLSLTGLVLAGTGVLPAQALDRSVKPAAGPTPTVHTPDVTRRTLPNGLELWVVTDHELPMVDARLVIRAGSAQEGTSAGLAALTASLLDEGTTTRSATEFADAVDRLGVTLRAGAGDERTDVSLTTLTRTADSAFALMGEMVTQPAFADAELERERKSRLQSLAQQKDQPTVIATQTFDRLVYGGEHPYGHPGNGTQATIGRFSRDDVRGFYGRFYRPNNAVLVVVGDLSVEQATRLAGQAFGSWSRAAVPAAATAAPVAPAQGHPGVFLVDKPGAAQSEIRIGHSGAPRSSPDYYPLLVMNAILGGQFSSRINLNLREDKGYTYGARSTWAFDRGPGPFIASAGVVTAKTDSSLIEFMRELKDIRGSRPATADEVAFAKRSLERSYPRQIETDAGVAGNLANLAFFGLPPSELSAFVPRVEAVSMADVNRVARTFIHPDRFTIVVVGDLARVQAGIEALDLGPVTVLDAEGNRAGGP